jgi:hypothetical protein
VIFEAEGLVGFVLLALWVYCIIDVIATDGALVRNLPKLVWLFLVIILASIGSIAWLVLGRPQRAGWWPGDTTYRRPRSASWTVRGPEDDPSFKARSVSSPSPPGRADDERRRALEAREAELRRLELDRWEADLARREQDLRDDSSGGGTEP